jgi:UDP-glucose:glycoprotein glucosyltransferase
LYVCTLPCRHFRWLTSSQDGESKTRVTFVHNPGSVERDPNVRPPASWLLSHLLAKNLLSKSSSARLLRALGLDAPVSPSDDSQIPLSKDDLTDGVGISGYSSEDYDKFLRSSRLVARDLQLAPGHQALLVNGRVSGSPSFARWTKLTICTARRSHSSRRLPLVGFQDVGEL